MSRRQEIERLVERLERGGVSRREFVFRATALGLSLSSVGLLLNACKGKEGGAALQQWCQHLSPDNLLLITLPELDWREEKAAWFTALVNHALHPAIALPLAGTGGPPVSLQAIGPLGSETSLIDFGRTLEESGLVGFIPAPMATGTT